jgi:hypothetical protein
MQHDFDVPTHRARTASRACVGESLRDLHVAFDSSGLPAAQSPSSGCPIEGPSRSVELKLFSRRRSGSDPELRLPAPSGRTTRTDCHLQAAVDGWEGEHQKHVQSSTTSRACSSKLQQHKPNGDAQHFRDTHVTSVDQSQEKGP